MKYSKIALILAMGAVLPCRADDTKPAESAFPGPIAAPQTSNGKPPYVSLGIDVFPIDGFLKAIAKIYNFSISVDENIHGSLEGEDVYYEDIGHSEKGVVEHLDWVAKKASLSMTIEDDGTVVVKQLPKGQFQLLSQQPASISGFHLKLSPYKRQFLPNDRIELTVQLEREAGRPAAAVMWGSILPGTLQAKVFSLKARDWLPTNRKWIDGLYVDPYVLEHSGSKPTAITAQEPLGIPYYLDKRLNAPLEPGRYLFFMAYQSHPKGKTLNGQAVWEGQVVSNVVEFEVLPAPKAAEEAVH